MDNGHVDVAALRRILADRDITQTALAHNAGLNRANLNKVLRGHRTLSDRAAIRVGRALAAPVGDFTHPGPRAGCTVCTAFGRVAA